MLLPECSLECVNPHESLFCQSDCSSDHVCATKQELEGVLPEVQLLCEALLQREGILAAAPGRRLKGVAFAPELQVWRHTLQCTHQHQRKPATKI